MQSNAKQSDAKQSSAKQCNAKQYKAKQHLAMRSKAKQSDAKHSNPKQSNPWGFPGEPSGNRRGTFKESGGKSANGCRMTSSHLFAHKHERTRMFWTSNCKQLQSDARFPGDSLRIPWAARVGFDPSHRLLRDPARTPIGQA